MAILVLHSGLLTALHASVQRHNMDISYTRRMKLVFCTHACPSSAPCRFSVSQQSSKSWSWSVLHDATSDESSPECVCHVWCSLHLFTGRHFTRDCCKPPNGRTKVVGAPVSGLPAYSSLLSSVLTHCQQSFLISNRMTWLVSAVHTVRLNNHKQSVSVWPRCL